MFKKGSTHHELGHIKIRFFDAITVFKPAVTILVFDWEDLALGLFDWPTCEEFIMLELKAFQDKC
jgi:hypothetical protein